jgi:hypothetical protein
MQLTIELLCLAAPPFSKNVHDETFFGGFRLFSAVFGGFRLFYRLKRVCRTTFTISHYAAPWSAINSAARQRSSSVLKIDASWKVCS